MAEQGYPSYLTPGESVDPIGAQDFMVRMILGKMGTATLVKVVSCTNAGGLSPVGFVDVQPLVNQVDGAGVPVPHGVVHGLPYFRLQGGANAVIIDPQAGDIGVCVFASRDISSVKANKGQANPGSFRQFDMADGMYFGGMLNGTPSQYVQFSGSGITITSPTAITLNAPTITMNASTSITATAPQNTINSTTTINGPLTQGTGSAGGGATMQGPLTVNEDVTAQGTSVHTHVHSGVQSGGSNTGEPV